MIARPGKQQAVFNAGEIGSRLSQRVQLAYYAAGLKTADRIELLPQGGFRVAKGLRYVGSTRPDAGRLIAFAAVDGTVYDLLITGTVVEVWKGNVKVYEFAHPYNAQQVKEILWAQDLDTLVIFHQDVAPWRVLHGGDTTWVTGPAPLTNIPTYDFGGVYTNGVADEFDVDFIGFDVGTSGELLWNNLYFILTVNGVDTAGLKGPASASDADMATLAANVQAAILNVPGVKPGITVTVSNDQNPMRLHVVFGGSQENLGDIWSLSGRVVDRADAAVLCSQTVVGVSPGEPIISDARGWPRCGNFYQLRLLMGGFKSLPNAWMASTSGEFFDYDTRLNAANGAFVVPVNLPGGDAIEGLAGNEWLVVMTTNHNYFISGSQNGISKTTSPVHIPSTDHGCKSFVPTIDSENSVVYVHRSGFYIGDMQYDAYVGNFVATDLTLLAYQLVNDITGIAVRRKDEQQSANVIGVVNGDGTFRLGYLLKEQKLTGFARHSIDGSAVAVTVNYSNQMGLIVERLVNGSLARSFERFEDGLLLDGAVDFVFSTPTSTITGLTMHEGAEVWALADGNVCGPFVVQNASINLGDIAALNVTVGRWTPPIAETLTLSRMMGPELWLQRRARIHSVQLFLEDTTSVAVSANGGKVYDVSLRNYDTAADVPELQAPFTGVKRVRGFGGHVDEPTLTITQVRPGRLTVRAIVLEATLQ